MFKGVLQLLNKDINDHLTLAYFLFFFYKVKPQKLLLRLRVTMETA